MFNDKDNQDDAVTKSLVSLLGDLASNVSGTGPIFAQKAYVQQVIQVGALPAASSPGVHQHSHGFHLDFSVSAHAGEKLVPNCSAASTLRGDGERLLGCLQEARNSQDPALAESAGWAYAAISKAVQAAGAAPQQ